jgi:acetaldehyde dehydrogenase
MEADMEKIKVAIIGSGNIGTDLMIKVLRHAQHLELCALVGIDAASDGLARAKRLGIATTHEGIEGFSRMPEFRNVGIVFDATSAGSHKRNAEICTRAGMRMIDMTPAAIGPYVIPAVNLDQNLNARDINMVTCGGQATIPIISAIARIAKIHYAEIVAAIASKSAGPGTRANIDEFTETTARAIEQIGGARYGKALIVLNPAEPPLTMRDTIYCLTESCDHEAARNSIEEMVTTVQSYVPGYRLKQKVQFEEIPSDRPVRIAESERAFGTKITVFLEVEGAAHYLPAYAGNLDIMTSAALATAEKLAVADKFVTAGGAQ